MQLDQPSPHQRATLNNDCAAGQLPWLERERMSVCVELPQVLSKPLLISTYALTDTDCMCVCVCVAVFITMCAFTDEGWSVNAVHFIYE